MTPQQVAVLVVAATLGLLVLLLVAYGRPRRRSEEPLPTNFNRGDPDAVLEGKRLQQVQVWGVASSILITGFLAVYFVAEPFREAAYTDKFHEASVERGKHEFIEGVKCAQCHGPDASGGFAATDPQWPAPPLNNVLYRYTRDEVEQIVARGRPGTPMPAWAVEHGGALNSQKIEDVINYLETIQVPEDKKLELGADVTDGAIVFARKCAVCHGPDAGGRALGQPLPTFYAPDLTTEFYRLGLKVKRDDVRRRLAIDTEQEPTEEEVDAALARIPDDEILAAGEGASRNTVMRGRTNTPMPGWRNRISDNHIDLVVQYLKSIQRIPD